MNRTGESRAAWCAMVDPIVEELLEAQRSRTACALVTIAATKGSVPRATGGKMLVYQDGKISGTIGGGKLESLVIGDALQCIREKVPALKSYPLREGEPDSFGAICGGEVTALIEPQNNNHAVFLVGGGHCSRAIAQLALECGMHVTVIEERSEVLNDFPLNANRILTPAPAFIRERHWCTDEALLLVSRNHELDQAALAAALEKDGSGYIGMIGSRRKVHRVFDALREAGVSDDRLSRVFAPLGLDIGADSPAEIAVSAVAELLKVMRDRSGAHLALRRCGDE